MKIYEINPFVRFAGNVKLTETSAAVRPYDSRLFYVLRGNATVTVNDDIYKIDEDSVLLWTSGTEYKFEISQKTEIIAINFDYTQNHRRFSETISPIPADKFDSHKVLDCISFDDTPVLNSPIIIKCMPELRNKAEALTVAFIKKEMYYTEKCSLKLKEIILDILQYSAFSSTSKIDKIKKIIDYINNNYSESISTESLAKMANYHPYHLNKLMVKFTSFTTHQYILNLRLEKAKGFLKNRSYSIAEIAERCGFNSAYHFSNSFKKKYSKTPMEYRNMFKNTL